MPRKHGFPSILDHLLVGVVELELLDVIEDADVGLFVYLRLLLWDLVQ